MTDKELVARNTFLKSEYPALFIALNFHKTHKNRMISFEGFRYLRSVYLDKSDYIVIKKSTQAGLSEWLVINALSKAIKGRSIFYVLPTDRLVGRFVKNRIDRSIEYTPFYKTLLKAKEFKKFSESVSLKHIGTGTIAFIGSNSASAFTEFPADDLIIDELDQCDQGNLPMADERLSASADKAIIKISNPTLTNFGIDYEFNRSDMKKWYIKCESCGEWLNPNFFQHVVREVEDKNYVIRDKKWERDSDKDIDLICHKCGKAVSRFKKGSWVAEKKSHISGYQINKLFSTNVTIREMIDRFQEGMKDDTKLTRFYNGDLGEAFVSSGSKISYDFLHACKSDYAMPDGSTRNCIAGIDVGNKLHTIVAETLPDGFLKTVFIGELNDEQDIYDLVAQYNIRIGVIDALPEKRLSQKVCQRIRGFFRAFYKDVPVERIDPDTKIIILDRTASLDSVREMILSKHIIFPVNADKIEPLTPDGISNFFYQLCTSTRVFNAEKERYQWIEGSNPDHYFHAMNYLNIARRIIMKVMK